MINELQRMRNESATSDRKLDGPTERASQWNGKDGGVEVLVETEDVDKDLIKNKGGEDDIVRVEPEGSESKEKLNVVKT